MPQDTHPSRLLLSFVSVNSFPLTNSSSQLSRHICMQFSLLTVTQVRKKLAFIVQGTDPIPSRDTTCTQSLTQACLFVSLNVTDDIMP